MEQLIIDRNLNRFAYEGIAPHLAVKHIVKDKWEQYEQCTEDLVTIEQAKECATQTNRQFSPKI